MFARTKKPGGDLGHTGGGGQLSLLKEKRQTELRGVFIVGGGGKIWGAEKHWFSAGVADVRRLPTVF